MNHIKRLQQDLKQAQQDKATALASLTDLLGYLTSTKFTSVGAGDRRFLVNTQDVLDRMSPAITAVLP